MTKSIEKEYDKKRRELLDNLRVGLMDAGFDSSEISDEELWDRAIGFVDDVVEGINQIARALGIIVNAFLKATDDIQPITEEHFLKVIGKSKDTPQSDPRIYEVWSACTGTGGAIYHGRAEAENFRDACIEFFRGHLEEHLFDKEEMTFCECQLFDNKMSAEKSLD